MNRHRLVAASLCLLALASLDGCNRRRRRHNDEDDNTHNQPGMMQPGMQPGMMQPGMMQPGMMQPGMMQPGMQPGMQPTQPTQGSQNLGQLPLAGMLVPGGIAAGMLQQGDNALQDGSLGDDYGIMLTAGVPVTIVVRGGPRTDQPGEMLDTYAILLNNGVELTHNDDIDSQNRNSRIVWTPTFTGMHTLRVTTFGRGMKTGSYNIQVFPGAIPNAL